ncbi:MAG: helix-turn-helix transcriptional regulator [Pseudomonadota bacterium]
MGDLGQLPARDRALRARPALGAVADAFTARSTDITACKELEIEMSAAVRQLGYHGFDAWAVTRGTIGNIHSSQNLWAADYAPDVIKSFVKLGLAKACPVTNMASHTATPFDYVEALKAGPQNASSRWQQQTLAFFGVQHAWIVPLNTVEQMRGVTLYLKGSTARDTEFFQATRHDAHLLAVAFLDAFTRQSAPRKPCASGAVLLSVREVDCMQWVARGKTNWEVSRILSISENTVRFHLKNAFRKLDATSRSSAVMRAIQAGLIES